MPLAGTIPYAEELAVLSLENRPVTELKNGGVKEAVENIMKTVLGS